MTRRGSRQLIRLIFDREVRVGAIGVARKDIVAVPGVAEADLFRSLQSFVGVTSTHDLGAEIYVRGGNAGVLPRSRREQDSWQRRSPVRRWDTARVAS
ncbi:MAG: hypothetical protein OXG58_10180 [Gemmatimonadetes bacterium]|nr:hypothetical protein [Gemmatimonadota bacterium]MCY3943058.1 hypothetical protein [Gemmatimonadota bacterium]